MLRKATVAGISLRNLVRAEIHKREDKLLAGLTATQRTGFYSALQHLITDGTDRRRSFDGPVKNRAGPTRGGTCRPAPPCRQ